MTTRFSNPMMFPGADPCVLLADGTYYLYCTSENADPFVDTSSFHTEQADGSDGIFVYTSNDLVHWANAGLALEKKDVMGERWFWAPDVSCHHGKYYMVYAAEEHLAIASADSPLGPFRQPGRRWLREERSIDGHLFEDDDGTVYLYYTRLQGGNRLFVAKMSDDLLTVAEDHDICIVHAELDWETKMGRVTESPWMLKHGGLYYFTYSANHTCSPDYGVGCAVSDSPTGPFVKYKQPILHGDGLLRGTAGQGFFTAKDGTLVCVYHCHNRSAENIKPRQICMSPAAFVPGDGAAVLTVYGD